MTTSADIIHVNPHLHNEVNFSSLLRDKLRAVG